MQGFPLGKASQVADQGGSPPECQPPDAPDRHRHGHTGLAILGVGLASV
jgi:hypothetical protein